MSGLSVAVAEGERVALLGPSGAGKSTLLRALLGAVPARGMVRVGGGDPYGPQVRTIRRATGFLRQGDDLVLGVSARLNALMGTSSTWRARDWMRALSGRVPAGYAEQLAELAARHGVTSCLPARAGTLSGGQRQRIALIRALLARPRLLLADEPTNGLDPVTAEAAVDALRESPDTTVIVATHDLTVARAFPRVLAMRDGQLMYDGAGISERTASDVYGSTGW